MKANLIVKVLTGVVVLFFTSLSLGQDTKLKVGTDTKEACELKCSKEAKAVCNSNGSSGADYAGCISKATDACSLKESCENKDSKSDYKDAAKKCEDETKDFLEKEGKKDEACSGFTQDKDNEGKQIDCSQKLANCNAQMSGAFSDDLTNTNGLNFIENLAQQSIANKLIGNSTATAATTTAAAGNCIQEFDAKAVRDAEKDMAREKKDLEKDIKKELEEQNKLTKKKREKEDDIKEEVNKLEAENKKALLDKDKKMSEEAAKISKNSIDVGKRLRNFSQAITAESQNLAKANFEFQTAMLELTDEKVTQRCKQEFETLKAGLVNSKGSAAPAGASAEEKKQYESLGQLAAQYRAKGIKGSGELKSMLLSAKKSCFERAQTNMNKNNMLNSQAIKNSTDRIAEIKSSIDDEKKRLAEDNKSLTDLKAQAEKEKNAEETEKVEKLNNLNSKLSNFAKSTEEEIALSKAQADKLKSDIEALVLKKNFNAKPAMSDAKRAIKSYETARAKVTKDCCADAKATKGDALCSRIKLDKSKFDKEKDPVKPDSYGGGAASQ